MHETCRTPIPHAILPVETPTRDRPRRRQPSGRTNDATAQISHAPHPYGPWEDVSIWSGYEALPAVGLLPSKLVSLVSPEITGYWRHQRHSIGPKRSLLLLKYNTYQSRTDEYWPIYLAKAYGSRFEYCDKHFWQHGHTSLIDLVLT